MSAEVDLTINVSLTFDDELYARCCALASRSGLTVEELIVAESGMWWRLLEESDLDIEVNYIDEREVTQ